MVTARFGGHFFTTHTCQLGRASAGLFLFTVRPSDEAADLFPAAYHVSPGARREPPWKNSNPRSYGLRFCRRPARYHTAWIRSCHRYLFSVVCHPLPRSWHLLYWGPLVGSACSFSSVLGRRRFVFARGLSFFVGSIPVRPKWGRSVKRRRWLACTTSPAKPPENGLSLSLIPCVVGTGRLTDVPGVIPALYFGGLPLFRG